MEKILINTQGSESEIRVGDDWRKAADLLPARGVFIITDQNVRRIYGPSFPHFPVLEIQPGEESKSMKTIEYLGRMLLDEGVDRSGFILAIGGGVVCDIAGFLASIYMRGIRCGYVSTSLLSQVDASTGGKNGVNLNGVKNILGTIIQPEFVFCDPSVLVTLSEDEYLSGLAELIKTAIIGDRGLFDLLEQHRAEIMSRNTEILEVLISRAIRYKAAVVSEDEKEKGLRRILNFGHTFGHAIEMEKGLKHGFAVAAGIELAAIFSYEKGLCNREDMERIIAMLHLYDLTGNTAIPGESMKNLILHDKKIAGDDVHFIFTCGPGNAVVQKIPAAEATEFYQRHLDNKRKE